MSERLNTRRMIGLGLALGIGITACAQTPPISEVAEPEQTQQAASNEAVPEAKHTYYPNGYRLTEFPNSQIRNIWAHCDGDDLVETMDGYSIYQSPSEERTQNHDACVDDGRLDPTDFEFQSKPL